MASSAPTVRATGRLRAAGRLRSRSWWLVLPAVVALCVFFVYPVGRIVGDSFFSGGFGLDHYSELFDDGVTVRVLVRTILVSFAVATATLLLAYPYAYLMTIVSPRARALLIIIVLLPFWTSLMARGFAWVLLMQDNGPIDKLLGLQLMGTVWAVIIAMTQVLLAFMVLPLYSSMQSIDRRLLSAASSLGATRRSAFMRVYLPLSVPGIVAGFSLVFILSVGFYVIPALLGSSQESVVAQLIQERTSALLDFPGAGALGTLLLVVTLGLLLVVRLVARRFGAPSIAPGGDR